MSGFRKHAATVGAVLDFIAEERTFAPRTEGGLTPTARIADLRKLYAEEPAAWSTGQAAAFRLFLHSAPLLADVVAPVSWRSANSSLDAPYDPLTLAGFEDVAHFIGNGLLDDWWIALYEKDGTRRIVDEAVDDCVQCGGEGWPDGGFPELDRDLAWMAAARRTVLDMPKFIAAFAGDIAGLPDGVPTSQELTELWLARPYDDFVAGPRP